MYVSLKESLISNTRNIQGGNTSVVVKDLIKIVDQEIINRGFNQKESENIGNLQASIQDDKVIISEIDKVSSGRCPEIVMDFDGWNSMKLPKHIVFNIDVGDLYINEFNNGQKIDGFTFDTLDNGTFTIALNIPKKTDNLKIKNCTFIARSLNINFQYPYQGKPPYYGIRKISGKNGKDKIEIIPNNTYLQRIQDILFNGSNKIVLYSTYLQKGRLWIRDFGITIPMNDIEEGNLPIEYLKPIHVKGHSKYEPYQKQFKNTYDGYGDLHANKYPFNIKLTNLMRKQIQKDLIDKLASGSEIPDMMFTDKDYSIPGRSKDIGVFMTYGIYDSEIKRSW